MKEMRDALEEIQIKDYLEAVKDFNYDTDEFYIRKKARVYAG